MLGMFLVADILKGVGINLVIGSLRVISSTTSNIYNLMSYIKESQNDVSRIIMKTDIETTIKILDTMLTDLGLSDAPINGTTSFSSDTQSKALVQFSSPECKVKTFMVVIDSLKECLSEIEKELGVIQTTIEYNNSVWFSWRAVDLSKHVENISMHNNILKNRIEMFKLVITLMK